MVFLAACGGGAGDRDGLPGGSANESPSEPPAHLVYLTNPALYVRGRTIEPNLPSAGGGAVASYTVSPGLPAGLRLDPATGAITGTPTAPAATATYVVTATNTGGTTTAALTIAVAGTGVSLRSDSRDWVGSGAGHEYTSADSAITVSTTGGRLTIQIAGDEDWTGDFAEPAGAAKLQVGTVEDLARYPFQSAGQGGMDWSGEGRGCNTLTGWFAVDHVTYAGTTLTSIDLRFEQHCEGASPALRGELHWTSNDPVTPPGPVDPPPPGLWRPAPGATPATGNYAYIEGSAADYVSSGAALLYTQADAVLTVTATGGHVSVAIAGDETWNGDFQAMNTLGRLAPGYYGNLHRYPFHNPVRGGLDWFGEGRGCNTLTGWFVVDAVTYSGSTLTSIDLRFEQHCEASSAALHGSLRWSASDTTAPPGPVTPPPAGLWEPAAGAVPASGDFVYLQSDPGDYVGAGASHLYTKGDAALTVAASDGRLAVDVRGGEAWNGDFQTMNTVSRLAPGYYGNLQRYPFHNPVRGGLDWSGQGRGCNTLTGWFAVDAVTYSGSTLTSIDLRFEQHCEGSSAALHGRVRWTGP